MIDPVSVVIIGPDAEADPWAEGDIDLLKTLLESCGCRVVGYYGHWAVFHYTWFVVRDQA